MHLCDVSQIISVWMANKLHIAVSHEGSLVSVGFYVFLLVFCYSICFCTEQCHMWFVKHTMLMVGDVLYSFIIIIYLVEFLYTGFTHTSYEAHTSS